MTNAATPTYWFRWIAVLPGALVAGLLATFPLHWTLYSTLRNFVEPYPDLPERLLMPFAVAAAFVWSGSRIAPTYRIETSVVLFGLWMLLLGGFVFLTVAGAQWMGHKLYFQGGALAPVMAAAGALVGLYIVRRQTHARPRTASIAPTSP